MLYNEIMIKFARLLGTFMVLFSLLAVSNGVAYAQEGSALEKYFPETGHNVSGEFWKYYQSTPNADLVFGYPLTEAFTDTKSGRVIQYFTRARFELYPELPVGQQVHLSALGTSVYVKGQGVNIFTPMGCRTFSNGFFACYAFLDFFDKYGGQAIFGQPISGFELLNGRIVQYFEHARFDWYPEYGEGQKVVLADLGRIYFDVAKEDTNLLQPAGKSNPLVDTVLQLQTRAFVWKAVTQPNDQQAIYVVVQDQTLSPVYNANVTVIVYWVNANPQSISLTTDRNGVVIVPFIIQSQPYGSLVSVVVQVSYQNLKNTTVTSFRIWQ
jgi:hypothetical protein